MNLINLSIFQWIFYSNSGANLENHHEKIQGYMGLNSHDCDMVLIVGTMYPEQKMYNINLFLNKVANNLSNTSEYKNDKFNTKGCFATRLLGSVGWDGQNVQLVSLSDLPTDLCSVSQEMGQACRWNGSGPET